jgi:hypothetical protein
MANDKSQTAGDIITISKRVSLKLDAPLPDYSIEISGKIPSGQKNIFG